VNCKRGQVFSTCTALKIGLIQRPTELYENPRRRHDKIHVDTTTRFTSTISVNDSFNDINDMQSDTDETPATPHILPYWSVLTGALQWYTMPLGASQHRFSLSRNSNLRTLMFTNHLDEPAKLELCGRLDKMIAGQCRNHPDILLCHLTKPSNHVFRQQWYAQVGAIFELARDISPGTNAHILFGNGRETRLNVVFDPVCD